MTIRNLEAFVGGLWDWGILDGCFGGTKIRPTDIDGFVERNGQFLVLEGKGKGKAIPYGQQCAIEAMIKSGNFCVIVVWGDTNKPERIMTATKAGRTDYESADLELLRSLVSRWFAWADKKRVAA